MMENRFLTAKDIVEKIKGRELKAEDCVISIFERIEKVEDKVHAYVSLNKKDALQRARNIDHKLERGENVGRLAGVCIALKDNLCVEDVITTCSSYMLKNFKSVYNATVVDKLLREDAIIIGKTNMDEFAMGSSTETSYFGPTRNPWNLNYVPGGSSGGSAAAVASDEAVIALGSDTGGSIRCPASFCSVVGLKPTYGLVSRYGLIAYANSLEQIGPITKNVYDCALTLSVIADHDIKDSTTKYVSFPTDYTKFLEEEIEGIKVGVIKEFMGDGTHKDIIDCVWNGVYKLEKLGVYYREVSIPSLEYSLAAYYLIAMSEASSNLARYDGLRYGFRIEENKYDWNEVFSKNRRIGFGPEVRRRIILGTYALSAGYYDKYYLKALQVRTIIKSDFKRVFKDFDVLVGPTMPIPPFKLGEKIQNPLALYMCDVDTVPINLAGLPAISIPCGFSNSLPLGIQIIAPHYREDLILKIAYALERNSSHKDHKPKL